MPSETELYFREMAGRPMRLPLTTYQPFHVDVEDAPPNEEHSGGARVTAIAPDSQAAKAGLEVGDIVLTMTDENNRRFRIDRAFELKSVTNTTADHLERSTRTEVMLGILRSAGCV